MAEENKDKRKKTEAILEPKSFFGLMLDSAEAMAKAISSGMTSAADALGGTRRGVTREIEKKEGERRKSGVGGQF